MYRAIRYGKTKNLPIKIVALILAEKWGVAPWEIMERKGGAAWANLQAALDEARELSRKMDEKRR